MIRVYADMVADLFHYGHMRFLKKARTLGDHLLVGVCADEVLVSYKRRPILTLEERVASVAGCRYVDEVLPNGPLMVDRAWIEKYEKSGASREGRLAPADAEEHAFELSGGRLCLDLANTLNDRPADPPRELLNSYGDLVN